LYTVKVQNYRTKGGIVWIRQRVDQRMHGVPSHCIIVDARSVNKLSVELPRKNGIGQLAEELFQQAGHTVDVVLKGLGIPKVDL
jgi:hypothetical protein